MSLSQSEGRIIMGMLARGDKNHDIAAWFGENPARVAEVKDGTMFGVLPAAPASDLPPKGAVGPKARRLRRYALDALAALKDKGADCVDLAIKELEEGVNALTLTNPDGVIIGPFQRFATGRHPHEAGRMECVLFPH